MASRNESIVTEPPPSSSRNLSTTSAFEPTEEAIKLLKRQRGPSPSSPQSAAVAVASLDNTSPIGSPAKSARLALATPLTGAAALEDERRRREAELAASPPGISENPSHKALESLMSGASQAVSRPSDAPQLAPTAEMEPSVKTAPPLTIPTNTSTRPDETSPQSAISASGIPSTESPVPMDMDGKSEQQIAGPEDRPQPTSLSYPGSLQASVPMSGTPARGMSYPVPFQSDNASPPPSTGRRHKCPYCSTEFTRHHNLKSHLLTHSQEKPYVCTDCQMRFRRLHDLKRHGKLHTGEKPHICPKCDRKFARGDALARHAKGAGGCAGRRSSMGSFADGDEVEGSMMDGDDSVMSGISYDNSGSELRRQSLPTSNAQQNSGGSGDSYGAHSRTYPPVTSKAASGHHTGQTQSSTSNTPSGGNSLGSNQTSMSSMAINNNANAGLFPQTGISESPKPLSPGGQGQDHQRPSSLTQQFQQQHLGRRTHDLSANHGSQVGVKLPGISQSTVGAAGSLASNAGRSSVTVPSSSEDSGNMFAQSDPSVWAYIQALEDKVKTLTDKVTSLDKEVTSLRKHSSS